MSVVLSGCVAVWLPISYEATREADCPDVSGMCEKIHTENHCCRTCRVADAQAQPSVSLRTIPKIQIYG